MSEFNVAIISKNCFQFNENDIKNLTKESLNEMLFKYVTLKKVTLNIMMEIVVNVLNLDHKLIATTSLCLENNKYVYQLCHLDKSANATKNDEKDINGIGSILTLENSNVYGDCVLICSGIAETGTCVPENIDMNDISNLIYNKIFKKCIKINNNGSIDEVTFLIHPLENEKEKEKFKSIEFTILNFNLVICSTKDYQKDQINETASKLAHEKIYGDAYLFCLETENYFFNLDKDIVNKMLFLCEGNIKKLSATEEENKKETLNGLPVVKNKCILLEKRYRNKK